MGIGPQFLGMEAMFGKIRHRHPTRAEWEGMDYTVNNEAKGFNYIKFIYGFGCGGPIIMQYSTRGLSVAKFKIIDLK